MKREMKREMERKGKKRKEKERKGKKGKEKERKGNIFLLPYAIKSPCKGTKAANNGKHPPIK